LAQEPGTVIQCDFDGTVTERDVSFMLLDAFANGDWWRWEEKHRAGQITVGRFNSEVFSMVTADRQTMLDYLAGRVRIRPGFEELVAFCRRQKLRLVIVSNGLDFYIRHILDGIGLPDIEVHAARTCFHRDGVRVQYVGPSGDPLDDGFKEAHVNAFLAKGHRVVYIGDGGSDLSPARRCHQVFATDRLLSLCRRENVHCVPFDDFHDVIAGLVGP
jgi:2-hydroxy-3-keto-5-methylthiopentenyl-1-phosphate phosphatase